MLHPTVSCSLPLVPVIFTMIKFVWIFVAVLAVTKCEPPVNSYGAPLAAAINDFGNSGYDGNGGHDGNNDHDHSQAKAYEFGYQVKDDYTGNNYNRKETSDGNEVRGEYRVLLPDGRTQIVTYYADWQTGFHADVRYEGTAHYPEQYNNYQEGYYNNQYQNNGYNGDSASSSVSIKDYSNGNNNGYNSGYNNNNYDSYSGNFGNKGRPGYEYGAP